MIVTAMSKLNSRSVILSLITKRNTYTRLSSTIGSKSDCRSLLLVLSQPLSHTFMVIDHEISYMVIILLPLIQEGSLTSKILCTKCWVTTQSSCPGKSVVR